MSEEPPSFDAVEIVCKLELARSGDSILQCKPVHYIKLYFSNRGFPMFALLTSPPPKRDFRMIASWKFQQAKF